jgi:3-oxoacyl-[acyl-carrier protein] reductase
MELELKDKVAVITGGSRGIGRETAIALTNEGAHVIIVYHTDEKAALETERLLQRNDEKAKAIRADVAQPSDLTRLFEQVTASWGGVDILVNNASAPFNGLRISIEEMSLETWQTMLDVSLTGAFLCSQKCIPYMRSKGWGRIVNVTSGWGMRGTAFLAHYCAAKAGLIGLTTALAAELGESGILINAVAPGLVRTEAVESMPEGFGQEYVHANPLKRMVEMKEVAEAILYLSSNSNRYINGHVLAVSGGLF